MTKFWKPIKYTDTVQLGDETIRVEFYPEDVMDEYFRALRELIRVEKKDLTKSKNADLYAEQFIRLVACVFGDNSRKVLDFFDNNYAHAIDRLVPYFVAKIAPVMRIASKEKAQRLKRAKRGKL